MINTLADVVGLFLIMGGAMLIGSALWGGRTRINRPRRRPKIR